MGTRAEGGSGLFAEGERMYGGRRYADALPLFERADSAFRAQGNADSVLLALVWQGWCLIYLEEFPEVFARLEKARQYAERHAQQSGRPLDRQRRIDLERLFQKYYSRMGDHVRTGISSLALVRLYGEGGPPYDRDRIGDAWNKYGAALALQHRHDQALAAFDSAALWHREPLPADAVGAGSFAGDGRGGGAGSTDGATSAAGAGDATIGKSSNGHLSRGYLAALNNRANVLRLAGRHAEALEAHRHILALRTSAAQDPTADRHVAVSHYNVAHALLSTGQAAQALPHVEAFLSGYPGPSFSWRLNQVRGYTLQGQVLLAMDQPAEAEAAFDQAMAFLLRDAHRESAWADQPNLEAFRLAQELLPALDGKAQSLHAQAPERAWAWSCSAMDLVDSLRIHYPEGLSRAFYEADIDAVYRHHMLLFAGQNRHEWDARAWQAMERNKYLHLFQARQERQARYQAALPKAAIARLREIEKNLALHARGIREAQYAENDSALQAAHRERRRWQRRYDTTLDSLEKAHPAYARARSLPPQSGVEQVQALLAPDEAYLAFYDAGTALFRVALTRESVEWSRISWSGHQERQVRDLLRALRDPDWFSRHWTQARHLILDSGHVLYIRLLGTWLDAHPGVQRLTLLPDGALMALPFEALPCSPEAKRFEQADWLGTRYAIRYAHSGGLLVQQQGQLQGQARSKEPGSGQEGGRQAGQHQADDGQQRAADRTKGGILGLVPDYSGLEGWAELPGAAAEVAGLRQRFGAQALRGREARSTRLDSAFAGQAYRVLHLAAHSVVDSLEPLDSYILLADGPWATWSIAGSELDTRLVVLSSCSSLGGRHVRGEGLYSLARAFFQAGSSGMLGALWLSDDRSTARLMEGFYGGLQDEATPSAALRDARVDYLAQSAERYRHPFYWAGFAYMGADAPLAGLQRPWWRQPLSGGRIAAMAAVAFLVVLLLGWRLRVRQRRFAGGA